MMTRRGVLLLALLAVSLAMVACEREPAPATYPPAPSRPRVAVMTPALAATLRWLDLKDLIVARHGYDQWSDQSLPVCGDQNGFDYEKLLTVNPTDILIEWGTRPLPDRLTTLAKERGWRIHNYSTLSLDDVAKTTDELAALFAPGPLDHAKPKPSERLRAAWSKGPGFDIADAGRVLLLVPGKPDSALGPGSAHVQILEQLGGKSAVEKGGPYQAVDVEDVLKLAPDVIVLMVPRAPGAPAAPVNEAKVTELLGPLAKLDLLVIRKRRVVVLDDPEGLLPSASGLATFADGLYAALLKWERE